MRWLKPRVAIAPQPQRFGETHRILHNYHCIEIRTRGKAVSPVREGHRQPGRFLTLLGGLISGGWFLGLKRDMRRTESAKRLKSRLQPNARSNAVCTNSLIPGSFDSRLPATLSTRIRCSFMKSRGS